MLRLLHSSPPLQPPSPSITYKNNKNPIFSSGLRFFGIKNEDLPFKKSRRDNGNLGSINAVEKDSEFEVDPDKAREALRQLDEQLQSLSKKQVKPPRIRAVDLDRGSSQFKKETSEISGSFLTSLASILLIFTIFYNVLFLTVIKPSVDGEGPFSGSSIIQDNTEERSSLQQLSKSPEVQVEP